MKDQQHASIQFTGYPISIEEVKSYHARQTLNFLLMRPTAAGTETPESKNVIDDPGNWSEDWFNNYE